MAIYPSLHPTTTHMLVGLAAMIMSVSIPATGQQLMTFDGVGNVRIGMTVKMAEQALGATLHPFDPATDESKQCWETQRVDRVDPGISYMIQDEKIVRIDVFTLKGAKPPSIRTDKGVGVGSTEGDIKRAYGSAVKIQTAPYFEGSGGPIGHDLTVNNAATRSGLLFETIDLKVDHFRVGFHGPLEYQEGCE